MLIGNYKISGYGALRDERTIINVGSDPSDVCSHSSPEMPSSPIHRASDSSEDLYTWMAKQDVASANLEGNNIPFFNIICLQYKYFLQVA